MSADSPESQASSATERWYVVIIMCLVYAVSIADRYVVSTVLEPIRLDLKLTDAGVGFLTGVPLGLFYVSFGIPMSWLADRRNRRNILVVSLIVWSAFNDHGSHNPDESMTLQDFGVAARALLELLLDFPLS